MYLIYEGVDISKDVEVHKADLIDNAGSELDSLELWFDDPKKLWSKWEPEKNHKVQVIQDGFKSGLMYIDELEQQRGMFIIRALPIPQEAKNQHTQGWEAVRFLEFATQLAYRYGFKLKTYHIENFLYDRVDQYEQADFNFLLWRCLLEGYLLKIASNTVNIYSESYMEGLTSVKTIDINKFDGQYKFLSKATNIFNSCKINNNGITSEFKPVNASSGSILKHNDIYIGSQAEGDRYSKNLLRLKNKYENTGKFTVKLDTTLAATSNINIKGVGLADGKYFCEQVVHRFIDEKTTIRCRKPLEGY